MRGQETGGTLEREGRGADREGSAYRWIARKRGSTIHAPSGGVSHPTLNLGQRP
jgi:hypothetical protein